MSQRPEMKINRYRFKYVQVPHDDRYYIVDYNESGNHVRDERWVQVAKIPARCETVVNELINVACKGEDRSQQIEHFRGRVEQHDEWLERHE